MSDSSPDSSRASSPEAAEKVPSKTVMKKDVKERAPKPTHPGTAEMVDNAIESLNERKGSSLRAIKKWVASEYSIDSEKISTYIKRYLKTAVEGGHLVRTSGQGANGSFKIAKKAAAKPKAVAPDAEEAPAKKVVKKEKAMKPEATKKTVTKKAAESKKAKAAQPKSPSKEKKSAKSPTKPKAPKAKKAASPSKTKKISAKN